MTETTNIENAQKLAPDGEVVLFELTTRTGTSVFFKQGPAVEYLGDLYESVPCSISAEKKTAEGNPERPSLMIGGDEADLILLKPALFSGAVDGGTLQKHVVELPDQLGNVNTKITTKYRIKQVQDYNRSRITLILARFTPAAATTVPYVKYLRPAYPHVQI